MPELPEVEVLVRYLRPRLRDRVIQRVEVLRPKILRGAGRNELADAVQGACFRDVNRRGKYLLFSLTGRENQDKQPHRGPRSKTAKHGPAATAAALPSPDDSATLLLIGHLGMTGRMYLLPRHAPVPKHAAAVFDLDEAKFVFEDTRYFGRLTLDRSALESLGPEPLGKEFTPEYFYQSLRGSSQAIKVKLLDQSLVAGIGNIYASEALFRAGILPRLMARRMTREQTERLWLAVRSVLTEAIDWGSTVPLDWAGAGERDGLFYYGRAADAPRNYEERLLVYDREGKPCPNCGEPIRRLVQAARSTFYCRGCQGGGKAVSK